MPARARLTGLPFLLLLLAGCAGAGRAAAPAATLPAPVVRDAFGRARNAAGITLVDWEGYLANPALHFTVESPAGAAFPVKATLSSAAPRLCFDLPSTAGATGPRKELELPKAGEGGAFRLMVWPDRDGAAERYELLVETVDARGARASARLAVRVVDQDLDPLPTREPAFHILLDYSQDQTGFFQDAAHRRVVEQAANDWAYFIDLPNLAEVPAGAEKTWIWSATGFKTGELTTNAQAYTGFRLYAYGVHTPEIRSGGEGSRDGGWQRAGGQELPLRRSGGLEIETAGNFNELGWLLDLPDAEWWRATNLGKVQNDLYSIAHHEMGHSLAFNPAYKVFERARSKSKLVDERLRAALGRDPKVDKADHFDGTADPASGKGAFGWEYHGEMPFGRWLITRFDLLALAAVGYPLRATSAFRPVELVSAALPAGKAGAPYAARLEARGGIPDYFWEVTAGKLPAGLALDPFTGELAGTPAATAAGTVELTVRVREPDAPQGGATRKLSLKIEK